MNTRFRTRPLDEATMRLTYPGQALYKCADCQQRVCLFSDLDATADNAADFVCPQCQARRQDVARRIDHTTVSAFCTCPACRAARTQEGAERIASWNRHNWAVGKNVPGANSTGGNQGRRWWE